MIKNDKISRAITVYVEGTKCNLNCSYCYIANSRYTGKLEKIHLKFDLQTMIEAFSADRVGGGGQT